MRTEILNKIKKERLKARHADLANMNIEDHEIEEIMKTIQSLQPDISVIDLDGNKLSNKGAVILTEWLHNFPKLAELSIQSNHIGKEGAISLFTLKKEQTKLKILFHGNEINNVSEMKDIEELALKEGFRP
ncbi:MAG: hypothetical protein QM652_08360 [Legionella sp.]|uniref:hypothetical protein n=1 Tax=Legionella sp. TaxID=459 RepID=UPI0039E3D7A1